MGDAGLYANGWLGFVGFIGATCATYQTHLSYSAGGRRVAAADPGAAGKHAAGRRSAVCGLRLAQVSGRPRRCRLRADLQQVRHLRHFLTPDRNRSGPAHVPTIHVAIIFALNCDERESVLPQWHPPRDILDIVISIVIG